MPNSIHIYWYIEYIPEIARKIHT